MKKKKYLIFAHYHSSGLIRDDILDFFKKSKPFFDKVVLISTNLRKKEKKKIPKNISIIIRKNIGYDFFSYKIGLDYFLKKEKKKLDIDLFFLNSSVLFVNTNKLIKSLNNLKLGKNEIWGLTKSYELTEHIQSYFFCFSTSILENKLILNWWKKIKPYKKRQTIVNKYELGMSDLMIKNSIKLQSIFKKNIDMFPKNIIQKIVQRYKEVFYNQKKLYKKNPTNYFWKDFYAQFGLVKIELIKLNPKKIDIKKLTMILNKKRGLIEEAKNN